MSDLIERDKVIETVYQLRKKPADDEWKAWVERLNAIPSARPKEGKWIDMGDFEQCSACKGTHLKEVQTYYGKATWVKTDFCPSCGADMRGNKHERLDRER